MIQSKNNKNEWIEKDEILFQSCGKAILSKNDVSIISKKAHQESKQSGVKGFCHNRFHPNMVISMTRDEEELMIENAELDILDVKLFVLRKRHRCHEQCPMHQHNVLTCEWTKHIYYAGIKSGGIVRKGCSVIIRNP